MTRLIDADALIKTASKPAHPGTFNVKYNYSEMRTRFLRFIDNQPTVDAVPVRHGKWIDGHCSRCGCDVPAYIEDWKWIKDMNAKYCPMCGARMDEDNG